MNKVKKNRILLLAPNLLGETLSTQLSKSDKNLKVFLNIEELDQNPSIVIWSIENFELASAIQIELTRLQKRWEPAPVLLIFPSTTKINPNELLQFGAAGLIQDPSFEVLIHSIDTLIKGGRVVQLKEDLDKSNFESKGPIGLGEWLLISGLQQINNDLIKIKTIESKQNLNLLSLLILQGRIRELKSARSILFLLWGPFKNKAITIANNKDFSEYYITKDNRKDGTYITLKSKELESVWESIHQRIYVSLNSSLENQTGSLLAIDSLNELRKKELFKALLDQLNLLINRMQGSEFIDNSFIEYWTSFQPELKKQTIRSMTGNYVRLYKREKLTLVAEQLIETSDLLIEDDDLPDINQMIKPLFIDKPISIEGQLIPVYDPRSIIHLQDLFTNWIIRNAEIICAEILDKCSEWPELRAYLLKQELLSTRELEKLRNQLNSKNRWQNFIEKPIQLYESKRMLYSIKKGSIKSLLTTEPRDEELKNLDWFQQQVILVVETRDALAPQLQSLIKKVGDLLVVLLTQVIGRSIGLIGRGIAQGMGRTLGRS